MERNLHRDRTRLIHGCLFPLFVILYDKCLTSPSDIMKQAKEHKSTYEERIAAVRKERARRQKQGTIGRLFSRGLKVQNFLTSDMWRIYGHDVHGFRGWLLKVLKVFSISLGEAFSGSISLKASALTYTTMLSIVPLLAVIISIAGGFGMQASVQRQLYEYFPGHQQELTVALRFVRSYMEQIHSNVLIIVGILVLLYAVVMLLMTVEDVFNQIWHIATPRSMSKRLLGYFAGFLILPLAIVFSSGANIFMSSLSNLTFMGDISLSPLLQLLAQLVPYLIWTILFTVLYLVMPNTKVRFIPALIAGVIAGVSFQLFQLIYISGQIWVSRYNTIYGSFAAIPLLLLFIQFSWMIALFGSQLAYAIQNIENYTFRNESANISRRFRDFVALVLMKKITKAFRNQGVLYNAELLAAECELPIVVVNDTLDKLVKSQLLLLNPNPKQTSLPTYSPATDINALTVRRVTTAMDRLGSENFRIDLYHEYAQEWRLIREGRFSKESSMETLLVDL